MQASISDEITPEIQLRINRGKRDALSVTTRKQGDFNFRSHEARISGVDESSDIEQILLDIDNDRSQSINRRNQLRGLLSKISIENAQLGINAKIDQAVSSGQINATEIGSATQGFIEQAIRGGASPDQAMGNAIEAIANAAIRHESFSILESMNKAVVQKVPISQRQDARNAIDSASSIIANKKISRDNRSSVIESKRNKEIIESVMRQTVNVLSKDADTDMSPFIAIANGIDPAAAIRIIEYQNKFQSRDRDPDQDTLTSIYSRMMENPVGFDTQLILSAVNDGDLPPSLVPEIMSDLDRFKGRFTENPLIRHPVFKATVNSTVRGIQGNLLNISGEVARNAEIANRTILEAAYDWVENNPEGSTSDFLDEMKKIADQQFVRYNPIGSSINNSGPKDNSDGFVPVPED
jgi:hypothetical protein